MNILTAVAVVLSAYVAEGTLVAIYNDKPRIDSGTGLPLEAGDGCLRQFGDKYYVYGTRYQACPQSDQKFCYEWGSNITWPMCGWRNMTFSIYSSSDLVSWKLESANAVPEMVTGTVINNRNMAFFEPAVVYNKKNNNYVMWFVMTQDGDHGGQGVAVSDSPTGPFILDKHAGYPVTTMNRSADLYLYQDDDEDQTAYLKHNMNGKPPANYVSRLSPDYRSVVETSAPIENGTYYEGGGIFKRGNTWYVMFGQGCCFCKRGGSSLVYTSSNPLGPYVYQTSINRLLSNGSYEVPAQQFGVSGIVSAAGEKQYWYTGMRFGSGSVKSYDFQYWWPLQFSPNGTVMPMIWENSFSFDRP
eukprot:TRINITY_DN30853_c0_g1_i1.p1 TRINITY_DN30853_c0_g1~~TRINITY_DN30853_c0_g1_i1.p1  ORF type:complete len:357 (+),score=43.80 TRINITY_DN30853_c0_g1_i1:53-1123(+)